MLQSGLGQLVVDELLYQRGRPPRSRYLFKHALIQDAAYQSLLKRTRQQYHQQVAKLLEDRFPEVASTQPELVAHHYTEANCAAEAIAYWHKAGAAAASKSANLEAIDQLRRGLALVEALPDTRERAERELDLQMGLGPALFATKVYSHPDIGRAYARALELCRRLGDHPRELTVLRGLMVYHLNLHEMEKAQHFAEEGLRVAERLDDAARLVGAHTTLGHCSFRGSSSRRLRTFGGASRSSFQTCSSRIGRVPTPAFHASSSWRSYPGYSVTRIGPSMS
jgi:predicted ATPase